MKNRNRTLSVIAAVLILAGIACNLPAASTPTPFTFPTPDLTMTAISPPTLTPTQPQLITATPVLLPGTAAVETATPTIPPLLGTFIPGTPLATQPAPSPTQIPATPTPARLMRPGPVVEAVYFHNPPALDGNLGDWSVPMQTANHIVFGWDRWDNADDLSARFMTGWDYNYLYLAARVTDEDYVQNARGESIYLGDSLEILFDANLASGFEDTSLGADNYQLGISPGYQEPGQSPEAYLWFPRDIAGSRSEVRISARRTDTGYEIETAIPWTVFRISPQVDLVYGFVFSVSDNDRTGQLDQQTMVSNVSGRRLTNPTTWGNLILRAP
jgi:hypothetical protein